VQLGPPRRPQRLVQHLLGERMVKAVRAPTRPRMVKKCNRLTSQAVTHPL
jgi:hypothetical protein